MKKLSPIPFFLFLIMVPLTKSFSQKYVPVVLKPTNLKIRKIAKEVSKNGWVYFKEGINTDHYNFFNLYREEFGLSDNDEMKFQNESSLLSSKYFKYRQYYKGIPVEGCGYTLQYNDNKLYLAFGNLVNDLKIDLNNVIKPEVALENAKTNIGAKIYAWESKEWESKLKFNKKDSSSTWLPKGELIIARIKSEDFRLAYKFNIISVSPVYDNKDYYIDAYTGQLIKEVTNIQHSTNTGETRYDGTQSFTASLHNDGRYYLEDSTRGLIVTKNDMPDEFWNSYDTHSSGSTNWLSDKTDISGHWAAQKSYDYFHNSDKYIYENANRELRVNVGIYLWAAWSDKLENYDRIDIGGDGVYNYYPQATSMASLDVVGHEYTHLVIGHTANLQYVPDESGALNESFADIFGMCIKDTVRKAYSNGSITGDWLLGSDFCLTRSFINPHNWYLCWPGDTSGRQPMKYHESGYWRETPDTGKYAHINSGVQNYWFYLLAHGGTYNGQTISGIGIQKAAKIAFTNLKYYLSETAEYTTAREGSIDAAGTLFGGCSNEVKQTTNAWAAVGVGDAWPALSASIGGPSEVRIYSYGQWGANIQGGEITSNGVCNRTINWYLSDDYVGSDNPYYQFFNGDTWFPYDQFTIDCHVSDGVSSVETNTIHCTIIGMEPLSVSISGDDYICEDELVQFYSQVSGGSEDYSYEWYINDEYVDNFNVLEYIFESTEWWCCENAYIRLRVIDNVTYDYEDSNVIHGYVEDCTQNKFDIEVVPNPASSLINVSLIESSNTKSTLSVGQLNTLNKRTNKSYNEFYTYSLIDNFGKKLYQKKTSEKNIVIPVLNYLPGVYHLVVFSSSWSKDKLITIVK